MGGAVAAGGDTGSGGRTGSGGVIVGSGGIGGTGGIGNPDPCSGLDNGAVYNGHCYVDATSGKPLWADSVLACQKLGTSLSRNVYLVVPSTAEERSFLVDQFSLNATFNTVDLWLGLECNAAHHPDITVCGCTSAATNCSLATAQAQWSWIDTESEPPSGWAAMNPAGIGRCGALTLTLLGWAVQDRACDASTIKLSNGQVHAYRTICEAE
jgi:hypothetical protein